ncbi:MAG TPA: hypothetical protein VGD69_03335 [Herpetosiphonaceae bacterium]
MRLLGFWLCLILAAALSTPLASATTQPRSSAPASFASQSHLGGSANVVKIDSHTAYLAEGNYLTILDVSDLPRIVPLASLSVGGHIQDIAIAGATAYVGIYDVGVAIYDVSNLQQPLLVATLPLTGYSSPNGLEIAGTRLYVRSQSPGLSIYDLQEPYAPVLLGQYTANLSGWGFSQNIALSGSTVYAISNAPGSEGVHVIDVSDPRAPTLLRIIPPSPEAIGIIAITISDGLLYIGDSHGLQIFNISAPAKPYVLGSKLTGAIWNIVVVDRLAYVVDQNIDLSIIDVSKPDEQPQIGAYPLEIDMVGGLQLVGTHLYVPQMNGGLAVVDVSDPAMPHAVAHSYQGGESWDLDIQASLAYVATLGGLQIVDISDPARPRIRSIFGQNVVAVKVAGDRAYLAVRPRDVYGAYPFAGLQVVDVADPDQPMLLGSIATTNTPWRVDVVGSRVFLSGYDHMEILDAADPAAILPVKSVHISQGYDLEIRGETVYVATPWGVSLVDLSGENVRAFDFEYGCHPTGLDVAGKLIYVATPGCGLIILEAGNPNDPMSWHEVGRHPSTTNDVTVVGKLALVSNGAIQALDVSDPAQPVAGDRAPVPSWSADLELRGNLVFAASLTHGLQIFRAPHR